MSLKAHPNVNAVKLMLDTNQAIMGSLRGPAELKKKELEFKLLDKSRRFAVEISEFLDDEMENLNGNEETDNRPPTKER